MGAGSWVEAALGSRMGVGPWRQDTVEKGLWTECHLESLKAESGEEGDETVPAHRAL